jgi:hypothetical protein
MSVFSKNWSGQTKDYEIDICCFSAKHAALRRKNTYWLARNQDNVSEWEDNQKGQSRETGNRDYTKKNTICDEHLHT